MTLAHSSKVGSDSSNRLRAMRLLQSMCALLITCFALCFYLASLHLCFLASGLNSVQALYAGEALEVFDDCTQTLFY